MPREKQWASFYGEGYKVGPAADGTQNLLIREEPLDIL
jgi:hypothetical protein